MSCVRRERKTDFFVWNFVWNLFDKNKRRKKRDFHEINNK